MRKTALPTTIAMVLGLAFAGVAFAADAPTFQQADSNNDGTISMSEASKVPGLDFAAADKNHDGVLTQSEYEEAVG